MVDWLYGLPEMLVLALVAAAFAAWAVIMPKLVQSLPFFKPDEDKSDFVLRIQVPMFSMTTLVLAFTLVQADINFRQAETLVSSEAARIDQLDRLLTRYHTSEADQVRPHLIAYAKSIVSDEWPQMLKTGEPSQATRLAFATLSQMTLAIDPLSNRQSQIFSEMLRSLDGITDLRATRLNTVNLRLPDIYWQLVFFLICLFMLLTSLIEQTRFRLFVLSTQAAVLGGLVGFVFLMDQPFKGETAIDAKAFVDTVARMQARTK